VPGRKPISWSTSSPAGQGVIGAIEAADRPGGRLAGRSFVARRLGAESVGLVFATRDPGGDLAGLPELAVAGLPEAEARRLLDAVLPGPNLLLDGLAAQYNDGYSAGLPMLRQALAAFGSRPAGDQLRWLWLAGIAAIRAWDDEHWDVLSARHVQLARDTGTLSELPLALISRAYLLLFAGDLTAAASLTDEVQAVKEATGSGLAPYGVMGLAALRGDEGRALALIEATMEDVTRRGEGVGITFAEWANAALNNGLGHYDRAVAAAQRASRFDADLGSLNWVTVELVEAAARCGRTDAAARALGRVEEMTSASGTDWGWGSWPGRAPC
jgi:hypothetical protein